MLQQWQQIYDPIGNIWISSAIALIPIVFFFLALAVFRMKGSVAGTITVALAQGTQTSFIQHHWIHDALQFSSHTSSVAGGLVGLPMQEISLDIAPLPSLQ